MTEPIKNIFIERMEMLNPELCEELGFDRTTENGKSEEEKREEQTEKSEFLLSDVKEKEVEI